MKICVAYLKNLKNTIFPESSDNTSVIADYYIRIMLFLYPMYLAQDQIWGLFSDKEIIYYILSLLSIILSFVLLRKRKVNQFRMKFIDIYLISLAIVMVMMISGRLIRKIWILRVKFYYYVFLLHIFLYVLSIQVINIILACL